MQMDDGAAGVTNIGAATAALQQSLQGELQRIKDAVSLKSAATIDTTAAATEAEASLDFSRLSTELLGLDFDATTRTTTGASSVGGRRHTCWKRALYNWLCRHRALVRAALVVEIVLIAVLAVVAVVWSFAGQQQQAQQQQQGHQDELTAPLIEDASRYAASSGVTVSPLWSHMIRSKADSYQYSRV